MALHRQNSLSGFAARTNHIPVSVAGESFTEIAGHAVKRF